MPNDALEKADHACKNAAEKRRKEVNWSETVYSRTSRGTSQTGDCSARQPRQKLAERAGRFKGPSSKNQYLNQKFHSSRTVSGSLE